jgi:hypothetical protein
MAPRPRSQSRACAAAFWTGVVLVPWILYAIKNNATGWDFPVFYIAGKVPLACLYQRETFEQYWRLHLQPLGSLHWAPYVRPAVFALPLRLFSAIPYVPALWIWIGCGLAAYLAAVVLLLKRFHAPLLLLPAFATFFPAILGLAGGNDTPIYLMPITHALLFLDNGRETLA